VEIHVQLFPKYSVRRRVLQTVRDRILRGPRLFRHINKTNLFLASQFEGRRIQCPICGGDGRLRFLMLDVEEMRAQRNSLLRENLHSECCDFWMRQRLIAVAFLRECRDRLGLEARTLADLKGRLQDLAILDTDAHGALATHLSAEPGFRMSSYIPGAAAMLDDGRVHNVDLQDMQFADASLDIVVSSDVLEHVRDITRAHREIFRCLRSGGCHIFTVPFDEAAASTRTLVDTTTPDDIYLDLPQIHGDRLTGGIIAYRINGMEMLDELRGLGYQVAARRVRRPDLGIFEGLYFRASRP
jgi:SAM-dependent methyltransferase